MGGFRPHCTFMPIAPWLSALLGVHAAATPLAGQERELVSGEVTCASCRITLDTVATIGGLDGPGLHVVFRFARVAVDRLGRIIVTDIRQPEFSVFEADGTFLRTVGQRGDGPGEYRHIDWVNAGPRYIHVFDHLRGRTMLDYDFNVVRTDRYPGQPITTFVMDSDDVVFNADVGTPTAVGHKFHVLTPSGEMKSFGGEGGVYRGPSSTFYKLTGDGVNTLWTIRSDANILRRWSIGSRPMLTMEFERRVKAFDDHAPDGNTFPSSWNRGLMLDPVGLWLVWTTPDPDWTQRSPVGTRGAEAPPRLEHDGWVDLIDPEAGLTIARHWNDGHLLGFAQGSRYVVAYHETDEGVPYLHLLEPRLVDSPSRH